MDINPTNTPQKISPAKDATIMVALSGGVDSAVTATLLQQQGYKVIGVFMRNWEDDDGTEECTTMEDWLDAQKVCEHLKIELLEANFSQEYKDKVFTPFIELLKQGYTPNPDILCNSVIKFSCLRSFATAEGADYLATGHYARLLEQGNEVLLYQAADHNKCQTYFLYQVGDFSNCLMPLGDMQKQEVRAYAEEVGLHNYAKKDSTGLCFIGERNFSSFISRYIADQPGDIVDEEQRVIGQHRGLFHYTLGQRQGLGIGGVKHAKDQPWFVIAKDQQANQLILSQGTQDPKLYGKNLKAGGINWLGHPPQLPLQCEAKIRYRSDSASCEVSAISTTGNTKQELQVDFSQEQRSITPGQSVVFYQDGRCLGGGIIA